MTDIPKDLEGMEEVLTDQLAAIVRLGEGNRRLIEADKFTAGDQLDLLEQVVQIARDTYRMIEAVRNMRDATAAPVLRIIPDQVSIDDLLTERYGHEPS